MKFFPEITGFLSTAVRGPGGKGSRLPPLIWGRIVLVGLFLGLGFWFIETSLHVYVFHTGNFRHELMHSDWNEVWMRSCIALLFAVLGGAVQWHLLRAADWARHLRRLASAVEQAGEAMIITDLRGRIEFSNPAFARITGYTAEEVRGQNPSVLKSGAHSQDHYRRVWETITAGRVWSGSIVDKRKDGTYYPALLTIAPALDECGAITHFVGVQHDVSHQVELEDRVRHAENLEKLGTFAAGIAHDFGNTLNLLGLQLQLATRRLGTRPGEVREDLAKMEQLLKGATKAVHELNAFARRGNSSANEPLEMRGWLEDSFPLFRLMLPTSMKVGLELPPHELWVCADAAALQQVIINLMQNARDALADKPAGAITLSCDLVPDGRALNTAAGHLDGAACVRVCVTDNGPGIEADLLNRIFEPFFSTKGGRGSGLGLAMAKETARRHAGAIRVLSRVGAGARFELLLPMTPPAETTAAEANRAEAVFSDH